MLSAFQAQPILELKPRDESKIESLLGYGDRILVGLNTGSLRIYRVNNDVPRSPAEGSTDGTASAEAPAARTPTVDLFKEEEKFSKQPVQQLARITEANVLVSLSDTYVSLHDLQSFELVERLERTRNATCFTVKSYVVQDAPTEVPLLFSRLAVGVKKKVLCWAWQESEMIPEVAEINMEAGVKSLTWVANTKLIVGMDPGFSVVDIQTQQITPINKPATRSAPDAASMSELADVRFAAVSSSGMGYMGMGSWLPRPMATGMPDGQVLLAKDVNTLFTDSDGKSVEKRQIPWSLAPEAIGISYPYLLALLPPEKGTLHIRNPDTLNLLQSIAVPRATILHVPQPYISLAHAGKGFLVASERTIWKMNALAYDAQVQELVQQRKFDEAVSLLNLLEDTLIDDKAWKIREVTLKKAIAWFQQQKYLQALDLFTNVQAPVATVLALYPRVIAGDLSSLPETTEDEPEDGSDDVVNKTSEAPTKDAQSPLTKGVLSKFMGGVQASRDSDTAPVRSSTRSDTDSMSIRNKAGPEKKQDKADDAPLEGNNLKEAVSFLRSFLAQARQSVQKHLNTDGSFKEEPLKLDAETNRPGFANLLPQSVLDQKDVDWHEELLRVARLVDTTLFRAYMLVSPSLAGSLFRIANFCDPDVVQVSLYENDRCSDLIDFLHGKKLHRQALEMLQKFGKGEASAEIPEGMRGPARTVAYLKQLPPEPIDLILEFVKWPISQDVAAGMDVFLADSDNAERLPWERVLEFLHGIDPELQIQYLEHLVNKLGDQDGEHHQMLIDSYLEKIQASSTSTEHAQIYQTRLEQMLESSHVYNKIKTFRQLPADEPRLYESRALVLSAMSNYKQALSIYVFQMQDYTKAETYCARVFYADQNEITPSKQDNHSTTQALSLQHVDTDIEKSNLFATLLGLYLHPPVGEEKRWPQALDLLSKHGVQLPASSTLALMPDDLAVTKLQDYFRGRLRHATSLLREDRVVRELEDVRRARVERQLALGSDIDDDLGRKRGRNRRVRITAEDHCLVCHKRFGTSIVRVYPDNVVVHYGCVGQPPGEQQRTGSQRPGSRGWS